MHLFWVSKNGFKEVGEYSASADSKLHYGHLKGTRCFPTWVLKAANVKQLVKAHCKQGCGV